MFVDLGKQGRINFTWKQAVTIFAGILAWGRVEIGFAVDRAECAKLKERIQAVETLKKSEQEERARTMSLYVEQNRKWQEALDSYMKTYRNGH